MSTNFYFQSGIPGGRTGEQRLVESLIIESIKIYGFDVYYLPASTGNRDEVFLEDPTKHYENAIPIEAYLENVDGYGGDGELMSKFGLEIRDTATFLISRSRWSDVVAKDRTGMIQLPNRPAEGDILYMPLTHSYFEVKKVDTHNPFYQLGKLHVYKLQCELFQYSSEQFNTGIDEVDQIEADSSLDLQSFGILLEDGSALLLDSSTYLDEDTGQLLYEGFDLKTQDPQSTNDVFNTLAIADILDFSEINPFGEVATR